MVGQAFLPDQANEESVRQECLTYWTGETKMNDACTIGFRRRHLPHWTVADRSYFVTIRLKGSIPAAVAKDLQRERAELTAMNPTDDEVEALRRAQFRRVDAILDSARNGPKFLNIAPVADIVFAAFNWLETQKGWTVHALSVMPNHVHTVLRNTQGRNDQLNKDLGVLKGFTARECNRVLERTGRPFWMDENFDHWIRHDGKLSSAVRYTAMNPVKAGLATQWSDWPWTRVGQAFLPDMERERNWGECQAGMPDIPAKVSHSVPTGDQL
jgi:putative transposase